MSRRYHRKVGEIVEGESRVFINIENNGKSMSIGIPKSTNTNRAIYLRNQNQVQYVTGVAGSQLLQQVSSKIGLGSSTKAISSGGGCCGRCGKSLRGNKQKPLCYECWKKA